MDLQALLFMTFLVLGSVNLLHLAIYLIGADLYDIWQARRIKKLPKRIRDKRPLVSVLIPAHNEAIAIIRCLESVRKSSYRKIEIIAIDDASSDETRKLIRNYITKHPNRDIKLRFLRENSGKASALNHALRRTAKGELIMMLDADSVLHKQAIKNAVAYFQDPRVVGVAANVHIIDRPTILGLLQKFEHMIGYRSKKFYTVTNSELIVGGVASTYRRDVLRKVHFYDTDTVTEDIGLSMKIVALGNRKYRIIYASDVVAMTEGVESFKALLRQRYRWKMGNLQNLFKYRTMTGKFDKEFSKFLTLYRLPMAFFSELMLLVQPFLLLYVVYLSIVFKTPQLFWGAYITITAYVLWAIWPDEHVSYKRKLSLSIYAPVMYFIFYIMDLVQIIAIIRCLVNPRQIFRKTAPVSNWISPERAGENILLS